MLPDAAKALKGVYDRAQPLVQVGTVIATAFATTLLPSLTEALQKRDSGGFYRSATSLIRVAVAISSAASVGMIALMPFINRLLFGSFTKHGALKDDVLGDCGRSLRQGDLQWLGGPPLVNYWRKLDNRP